MIDRKKYFEEVDEILKNKITDLDKQDFVILLSAAVNKDNDNSSQVYEYVVNKIVQGLFGGLFTQPLIPWNFLNTEIGKVIIQVKFGLNNEIYFINDLVQFTGYTKQFIGKEVKNGNIKMNRKHGIYYAYEKEVDEYLKMKNCKTLKEIQKSLYEEAKEEIINPGFEREEKYE